MLYNSLSAEQVSFSQDGDFMAKANYVRSMSIIEQRMWHTFINIANYYF